jgi:hypothetical protein
MAEKIKFKISIKELTFEYEGTREVGQALQAGLSRSLAGLVDTQKTVMLPVSSLPAPIPEKENGTTEVPAVSPPGEKAKKPRKSNGSSITNLILELKGERYFVEPRTSENIREKLKTKGHNILSSSMSGPLQKLTQKSELHRQQSEEGYVYKDTPFNESAGTPKSADKPAE